MTGNRWWHVLFGATMLLLVGIACATGAHHPGSFWPAICCVLALVVVYATLGTLALEQRSRATLPFVALMIVFSGAAIAFQPRLAFVQAIVFPLLWRTVKRVRDAVLSNIALGLAVSIGFLVSLGTGRDNVAQTVIIEGISVAGSIALGVWMSRIADLSAERKLLFDNLAAAQEQLAALHRESGVTSERERLARDIHDTIAQSLTGLVLLTQRAQRELVTGDLDALSRQLTVLEDTTRETLVETRSLVMDGAPVELGGGIAAALERLAVRFTREAGVAVTVHADHPTRLEREGEVVLLRCAQEALANVRKHAGALNAQVALATVDGGVRLTIRDDGGGFAGPPPEKGFGISGMRDRLALVDGTLSVQSDPGKGTTLIVTLPVQVRA